MIKKHDWFGILAPIGMAVITGLVYIDGKLIGKAEAYGECADMIKETIESVDLEDES